MICPRAVEALTVQQIRLDALIRTMDNGRWWSEDTACRIDENEVCRQAETIGRTLDVIERLAGDMSAEDGTGDGSQISPKAGDAAAELPQMATDPPATDPQAVPEDLGPFSPGQVGPLHDAIHESGGYEQRAWGVSGGTAKLA